MSATPLLSGVRKRTRAKGTGCGEGWCAEQVFNMRRLTARSSYWDAESDHRSDIDYNNGLLSPRSPIASDHLLSSGSGGAGGGGDSRNTWNKDDMFGEQQLGGGGDEILVPGRMETGGTSPPPAGGGGGDNGGGGGGGGSGGGVDGVGGGVGGSRGNKRHGGAGGGIGTRQRRIFLRMHKFVFQKELAMHFSMCILSIAIPFSLSGSPWLAAIPLSTWCFYNAMFVVGAKRAGAVLPGFDRFKRSFVAAMEELLPPRLVPVLSLSFLSVLIAVTLTAARLGGPPLCLSSCHACLGSWKHAHPIDMSGESAAGIAVASGRGGDSWGEGRGRRRWLMDDPELDVGFNGLRGWHSDALMGRGDSRALRAKTGQACGYSNGKELLAFYTVSQSAILIYLAVMTGLLSCLAWRISEEELAQRQAAESRLKSQNPRAFELRERMILEHGRPGSSVRPETTLPWLMFGLVAAFTFTVIGWRKWGELPPTLVSVVVIGANVTTTLASVLMLHVGFHGRLIALYQGNLQRVKFLSKLLREGTSKMEEPWVHAAEAWWFLRSFVLREDLSLDYDVGGLGVSATFFIVLASFIVAIAQIFREGLDAILNPPGSYCAYASVYLTVCLIRIFGLATKTYLEQQQHIGIIQEYSRNLAAVTAAAPAFSKPDILGDNTRADNQTPGSSSSVEGARSPRTAASLSAVATAGTVGGSANISGQRDSAGEVGVGMVGILPAAQEAMRRMVVHMTESDPYPCVLGIPVKPALFAASKMGMFVCFAIISTKLMYDMISNL